MRINKAQIKNLWTKDWFRIIVLILIAALLRVYNLSKESFRLDESGYVIAVFWNGLPQIIQESHTWGHPPFYFIIYNIWGKIFGISEFALISLSLIAGIISIVLIYLIIKKLFKNKDIAFVSALLTCFSLFHFHFSRDATEYSFFPMMIFLSTLAFISFVQSKPEKKRLNAIFYVITTALMFYTHYYAFMVIIVQNLAFFIFYKKHRKLLKTWITMGIILLVLITPELGHAYTNARIYGQGLNEAPRADVYLNTLGGQIKEIYAHDTGNLRGVVSYYFIKEPSYWYLANTLFIIISFFILMGIILPIFKGKGRKDKNKDRVLGMVLLILLFFVPIVLTSFFPIVYRVKGFVFSVLVYNTLITLGIWHLFQKKEMRPARIIAVVLILILSIMTINHSLQTTYFFSEAHDDWRSAAEFLKQPAQKTDLIVVHVIFTYGALLYYYNLDVFKEFAEKHYVPFHMGESNLISIEHQPIKNISAGHVAIPTLEGLKRFNESLQLIDDFWLASSGNEDGVYPNREVFNLIKQNFENVSEQYFGSVYVTRYQRK